MNFGGFGGLNGPGNSFSNFRGRQQGDFNGDQFGGGGFHRQRGYGNIDSGLDRMQNFNRGSSREGRYPSFGGGEDSRSQYGGFVKPHRREDQFEGGEPTRDGAMNQSGPGPSFTRNPYDRPRFSGRFSSRSTGRFSSNKEGGGPIRRPSFGGRSFGSASGGFRDRGGGAGKGPSVSDVEAATAAAARATREATKHDANCIVLAAGNVHLAKINRLAQTISRLKTRRPNAIDTLHSASNIAQVKIHFEVESGPVVRGTGTFFCLVQFDGVNVAVSTALNKRKAKLEAYEVALKKVNMPHKRIVQIDGTTKEFQASDYPFGSERVKQTVVKPMSNVVADISGEGGDTLQDGCQRETNVEALVDGKNKNYQHKRIEEFVLVEPAEHNSSVNGSSILRRSADFSKMLLEYNYALLGTGPVRCQCFVQGEKLGDVVSHSKPASKIEASQQAVDRLRLMCWTILTKQLSDTNAPKITKEEIEDELGGVWGVVGEPSASMSTPIAAGNLGHKMLQKMGWTGGGIGKDGAGIAEPVTMKQVINREGLGLDAERDVTDDFRSRIQDLLEQYVASDRQDDLVFSPFFRKDERIIIHHTCRRLNLKSKCHGRDNSKSRFLVVRRKRSAFELLNNVMDRGGETSRYKVVPPGMRRYPWRPIMPPGGAAPSRTALKVSPLLSPQTDRGWSGPVPGQSSRKRSAKVAPQSTSGLLGPVPLGPVLGHR